MLYFFYILLLVSSVGLIISGNQILNQQVKTSLPPEDLETIQNQLKDRKIIGQILMVIFWLFVFIEIT
jgi:hypothetical protein